jgi:hypothetical protein
MPGRLNRRQRKDLRNREGSQLKTLAKVVPWLVALICFGVAAFVWQDFGSQIKDRDSQLRALRAEYDKFLTESNLKITEANERYQELAEKQNHEAQLAARRDVPVRITFRKALLSSGNVAVIANICDEPIAISANVERPSSGQRGSFALTIDPGSVKEIGEREGWAFISKDVITVSQADHRELTFVAP